LTSIRICPGSHKLCQLDFFLQDQGGVGGHPPSPLYLPLGMHTCSHDIFISMWKGWTCIQKLCRHTIQCTFMKLLNWSLDQTPTYHQHCQHLCLFSCLHNTEKTQDQNHFTCNCTDNVFAMPAATFSTSLTPPNTFHCNNFSTHLCPDSQPTVESGSETRGADQD